MSMDFVAGGQQSEAQQQTETQQKKKLVITQEHFQRVTQALVMRLRQHEESVTQDGMNIHLCCIFVFYFSNVVI